MATIKFSNGQTVNFNGNPTQQDVEEIATKLGIHSPAPATPVAPAPQIGQGPAGEFSAGAVGSLIKTGAGIEKGLDETVGRVGNAIAGNGFVPTHTADAPNQKADEIMNQSGFSQAGGAAGTIAQYFTPGGVEKGSVEATALIPKAIQFLAEHAPEALKNTAIGTAQTGNPVQGVETGVGGELLSAAGKPLQAAAKGTYKALAIPVDKAEASLVQAYKAKIPLVSRIMTALKGETAGPTTAGDTAFRHGLFGNESSIGIQAKRASDALWNNGIKPALQKSGMQVNLPKFFASAEKKIISDNPELSRQNALLEALNSLKEDYKNVPSVSLEKLQDLKKGWATFVPQKAYQGKDIAGAFNDVKNIVAGQARQTIYKALGPEMKQAYIDHGNLQSLAEWGQKAMTGEAGKGGTGKLLSAAKDAIVVPLASIGGHVVYRVAGGMQFIGAPGARYLSDLFNEPSQN